MAALNYNINTMPARVRGLEINKTLVLFLLFYPLWHCALSSANCIKWSSFGLAESASVHSARKTFPDPPKTTVWHFVLQRRERRESSPLLLHHTFKWDSSCDLFTVPEGHHQTDDRCNLSLLTNVCHWTIVRTLRVWKIVFSAALSSRFLYMS